VGSGFESLPAYPLPPRYGAARPVGCRRVPGRDSPNGIATPPPRPRPRRISRQQVWELVKAASERADVRVLALRASQHGRAGEPAQVHPHLLRHARVRQFVRTAESLPIAQKQAGWARLQLTYLCVGDDEVRAAMRAVED
jgi:integrase